MNKSILAGFTMAIAASGGAAQAATVQISAQNPVVEIQVTESIRTAPDIANISGGVQSRAATASEAMKINAVAMDKMIKTLVAQGIKREDIQTAGINLNAQYQYRENDTPLFTGYEVSNTVSVRLKDIAKIGSVLDAMVGAGATNLNGPWFGLENDAKVKEQARKRAFERAQAQATDYAKMTGYAGVRVLQISEGVTGSGPVPMMEMRVQAMDASAAKTSVEPGQIEAGVSISVTFEMTR